MDIEDLTHAEHSELCHAIAHRTATASELAKQFDLTVADLRQFVDDNRSMLELLRQAGTPTEESTDAASITPTQLDDLWLSKKFERLRRMQQVADGVFTALRNDSYGDSTLLREFRSYLTLAANELGQLLHRGSGDAGDSDMVTYDFKGIDLDNLR